MGTRKRVGVGVVGVGTIGRFHLEAARRLGADVVAVAASRASRAKLLAEELGVAATGDYRDLLANPAVDVVHVCTPNNLHFPMARDALRAGKHVVCEKPLALTSHESGELLRLAEEADRVHAVCFNNRFYPLVQEARARVAAGALGRVFGLRGFILEDSLLAEDAFEWRLDPAQGGDSCAMATIGCHLIDLVGFVLGTSVAAVCADFTTVHPVRRRPLGGANGPTAGATRFEEVPIRSEEAASVLVRFASGAHGVLGVSRAAAGRRYRISLELDGTAAALAWDSEAPNRLWVGHDDRANELLLRDPALLSETARPYAGYLGAYQEGFADTFKALLAAVYRRINGPDRSAEPDFPTFVDGHAAMLVHDAVMASARTGAWVEVARAVQTGASARSG
ncbi:MAG TPA: Gfo/Idh/MocA family oxidoreductase [Chloroflexota bacterium]|jgi:predicted dehydrogenase|nr:Gfo/Idh/MocA family oxidoreductase [Chloroflexota bacterium]